MTICLEGVQDVKFNDQLLPRPKYDFTLHFSTLSSRPFLVKSKLCFNLELWFVIIILLLVFIHSGYFHSASSRPLLLRGAPDYSVGAVSELTRRSATGNCK